MKSLWNKKEAKACGHDLLKLRVYTSRLLGQEPSLVLHGGGNTSVKALVKDFFGVTQDVLYIKASGWDLAAIETQGFAAVKMDVLKRMAAMKRLTDTQMVREQRAAMLDPNAPNPSVEAILHAIIPHRFVDHTHADAVAAITNTPHGRRRIEELYGKRVLVVPYVMPGFILARKVYEMTRGLDWKTCEGIVLLNHGIFTFADDAKVSYERMILLVSKAENYIRKQKIKVAVHHQKPAVDLAALVRLRQAVSKAQGRAVMARLKNDPRSLGFAGLSNVTAIASRGTLTPDHVIRTKPIPVIVGQDPRKSVTEYVRNYHAYFDRNTNGKLTSLDPAPRWAVWPGQGLVAFGRCRAEADIVSDIVDHTVEAIQWAQGMGGWKVLSEQDIFEMEYWELEQAKLASAKGGSASGGKASGALPLQGKVALVTGASSGIGRACVETLVAQGAHVVALDMRREIAGQFTSPDVLGIVCDVTDTQALIRGVEQGVGQFGGLDIIVSNAGTFPPSGSLADMNEEIWEKSLAINLTSHQRLLKACLPYLEYGIDPSVIVVGSKNVAAPGPGAAAYSAAKAGLTQLARVAALELAPKGIRVNVVHPNQVFDTAIWTKDVLKQRAKSYGLSVEEYKTNNLLKVEITSKDVAVLVCALAGEVFAKTTGAQIPIDGGNDRVI
ncbi:MAG: bifunctional aldolase/short-chain dehydrogenase [Candidatus Omnitrophota bacterium]|nr:bifunctional aldolase/short-chain dehydrogenase [Candidatus Omnitrophota bacterium]